MERRGLGGGAWVEVLYRILDATGDKRVEIYRADNDTYRYEEQWWDGDPYYRCWCPTMGTDTSICASEEIAFQEAWANIPWLREIVPQDELA
ncbi:MAG: hypothetical protein WAO58_04150 [Fimbriimonadaceae bacterium]